MAGSPELARASRGGRASRTGGATTGDGPDGPPEVVGAAPSLGAPEAITRVTSRWPPGGRPEPGLDHLRSAGEDLTSAHELAPLSEESPRYRESSPLPTRRAEWARQRRRLTWEPHSLSLAIACSWLTWTRKAMRPGLGVNARNLDSSIYDVILHDVPIEDCIEPTNLRNLFLVPATIDLAGAR